MNVKNMFANMRKKGNSVQLKNAAFEKYEIKHAEYDYIAREATALTDKSFEPARYKKIDNVWTSVNKSDPDKKTKVMFVGDITCFDKQFIEAQDGKNYNFDYEFDVIKDLFAKADLVCGNLETSIVPEAPYRGEKYVLEQNYYCNAPLEFLDAVRKANIDVVTTANNHDLDTGAVGLAETIDHIEKFGLIQTGTFKAIKPKYELIDVNGYRIAIVAFATEHNGKLENITSEGQKLLLNNYSQSAAKKIITEARENGAELVFVCIHWGTEHKLVQNPKQEKIAKELAQLGYDCIIGSHPHVLQPFATVEADGRSVPVFYSMGNFVCNSHAGSKSRSVVACIDLERKDGKAVLSCSYIPTVTSGYYGPKKYVVLPIGENASSRVNVTRLKYIKDVMGDGISITKDIEFAEQPETVVKSPAAKKITPPDLTKVNKFPVAYDDGTFCYALYSDHARVEGYSADYKSVRTITVPKEVAGLPVTEFAERALEKEFEAKRISFRAETEVLSKGLCKNCISLEGFQFSSKMKVIAEEAFANCVKISGIVLKGQCERIESKAFANCVNLRSVKIDCDVTYIADDAFEECSDMTIYCAKGSYVDSYAKKNNIPVVYMPSYAVADSEQEPELYKMGPRNQDDEKHPAPIIAACYHLGKPLPKYAKCGNQPSFYLGKEALDGKLSTIKQLLEGKMRQIEDEELETLFTKFRRKYKTQKILDFNTTDLSVYFADWILHAKARGFSHDNYFDFEMYNKEPDIRDTFLNEGYRTRVRRACNKKEATTLLANKVKFNTTFHEFVQRDWLDGTICTFEEFKAFTEKHDRCFAKPICGTGGGGARVLDLSSDTVENLYEICKADGLIVEEIIKQHPTLAEFNSSTLNTVRVNTLLCADGTPRVLLTVARFGRSGNVVDNFHAGGVGAIVDIETGKIITMAIDQAHQRTPIHPDSKKEFLNFQFPEWEKVRDAVCRAAQLMPNLRHVGWDVAVTAEGNVEFVEGNSRPNFDVLQSPDQLGRRFRYARHIKELERLAGIKKKELKPLVIDITGMEAE